MGVIQGLRAIFREANEGQENASIWTKLRNTVSLLTEEFDYGEYLHQQEVEAFRQWREENPPEIDPEIAASRQAIKNVLKYQQEFQAKVNAMNAEEREEYLSTVGQDVIDWYRAEAERRKAEKEPPQSVLACDSGMA